MAKKNKCRWCGKSLDDKRKHPYSESFCFVKNERAIRSRYRPRVKKLGEAYSDGKLRSEFLGTNMEDILLKRQQQKGLNAVLGLGSNGYKVPRNISYMLAQGFIYSQVSYQRPWAVYVLMPDGKTKRKRFNNLYDAVKFHQRITYAGLSGGVVSLVHAYELPPELRLKKDKFPKKFKWCPRCADFRVYRRKVPHQQFEAAVKVWHEEKKQYVWKHRLVWVMECKLCGSTNREPAYRRANQPYELRRIKQGVRRVKPRKGAPRRKKQRSY